MFDLIKIFKRFDRTKILKLFEKKRVHNFTNPTRNMDWWGRTLSNGTDLVTIGARLTELTGWTTVTSSATLVQHGWGSWSTVAIDRLPVLGLLVDSCNTQVALLGLSTDVGVHAFIFSGNQSEIWTHENEWSRTTPVRFRSENWPKIRLTRSRSFATSWHARFGSQRDRSGLVALKGTSSSAGRRFSRNGLRGDTFPRTWRRASENVTQGFWELWRWVLRRSN